MPLWDQFSLFTSVLKYWETGEIDLFFYPFSFFLAVREYLVVESVLSSRQGLRTKPEGQINKTHKAKYYYHKAEPWAENIYTVDYKAEVIFFISNPLDI